MSMLKDLFARKGWIHILVAVCILVCACGAEVQPTPTPTVPPPKTSTPEPSAIPEPAATPEPTSEPTIGTEIQLELPEGNLEDGKYKALIYECDACHVRTPKFLQFVSEEGLPRLLERGETRMADPAYTGSATTNEEYVIESIVLPGAYVVKGWWDDDGMPADYGDRLTEQDLADILVWLDTFE